MLARCLSRALSKRDRNILIERDFRKTASAVCLSRFSARRRSCVGGSATRSLDGLIPLKLRVRRQAHPPPPSQRALASDARGRRSVRRPCVCLVLSSSAGARCAVVSSNATLFPPREHSAGRTLRRSASLACWRGAWGQPVTLSHGPDIRARQEGQPGDALVRAWLPNAKPVSKEWSAQVNPSR